MDVVVVGEGDETISNQLVTMMMMMMMMPLLPFFLFLPSSSNSPSTRQSQMEVREGDEVIVVQEMDEWCFCRLVGGDAEGLVPRSYIELR